MISVIIIVLRESLEICLILGMISAALNKLPNKNKLLFIGVSVGILISAIMAYFFNYINQAFEDTGQEIVNIFLLSTSVICIGWTLLIVKKQSKELYNKLIEFSNQESNFLPVILVITFSIVREGVELFLFLHALSSNLTNSMDLIYGIIIGAGIGGGAGLLLYLGLLKIPAKYFFHIINILLILVAAGMSSQIANNLTFIDIAPYLSTTIWDSSWLINEHSATGSFLHNLIGYSDHPTVLQFILFGITLITMLVFIRIQSK